MLRCDIDAKKSHLNIMCFRTQYLQYFVASGDATWVPSWPQVGLQVGKKFGKMSDFNKKRPPLFFTAFLVHFLVQLEGQNFTSMLKNRLKSPQEAIFTAGKKRGEVNRTKR